MKIKAKELSGAALDWAVAKAEGVEYRYVCTSGGDYNGNSWWETRRYSTDCAQGGPIIERERIATVPLADEWEAQYETCPPYRMHGATALVAAMRCYVASKLGDEIEIPEELL